LTISFSSKNWFERQSAIILLDQLTDQYSTFSESDKNLFKKLVSRGLEDIVANIQNTAESIKAKCRITF
jgi:hypothetical protein